METSRIIGQLVGSILLILVITFLLKDFFFKKYEPIKKNAISILIAVTISTSIYFFVSGKFISYYIIAGLILFIILQMKESYK